MRRHHKLHLRLAFVLACCLAAACSTQQSHPYSVLSTQGVLAVSMENPRLGSNLFLGSEAERSPNLYQFLETRGAPVAIEILQDPSAPTRFLMFYPRDSQVFMAVLHQTESAREWIISGPFGIQRRDLKTTAAMQRALRGGPAPFLINGRIRRFYGESDSQTARVLTPSLPTPTPAPTPPPPRKRVKKDLDPAEVPPPFKPLNVDQQAIAMAQGFAERNANGDIVHTVQDPSETLQSIAKWYTGSEKNAATLASANDLSVAAALGQGSRIRVPQGLIKKFKTMPPGFK